MTRPTLLFLTHRVPHPPNRGDRIRTFHFLRHLAARADVYLAAFVDEPVDPETQSVLKQLCADVAYVPVDPIRRWARAGWSLLTDGTISVGAFRSPGMRRVLHRWSQEVRFDATLSSSSALTWYQQLPGLRDVPAFVDLIDVDSQKWTEYAAASRGWKSVVFGIEGRRLRQLESSLADWMRGIAVVSEPEANIYRSFRSTELIRAIPNGVDVNYFQPQFPKTAETVAHEHGCVFVGVLDYKPNVDGICWFAREVWPAVRAKCPDQVLRIVGRSPAPAVLELNLQPGIEVVGPVPDVRPYLNQAAVAVVPLQIARGVQNKVLEALAIGKAVVASPEPLVGLDVVDGTHLLRAERPEDWVRHLVRLFNDPDLRADMGLAGHAYAIANHRWDQCLASLTDFLGLSQARSEGRVTVETPGTGSGRAKGAAQTEGAAT